VRAVAPPVDEEFLDFIDRAVVQHCQQPGLTSRLYDLKRASYRNPAGYARSAY
jgi:hypothetical protein